MNEIPTIITEHIDDIPWLLAQMQRMGLPTLLDTHFPTHGNWTGLSLGWVSTIWLSSILSRGDHRMVHVEPWVAKRLWTLGVTTGQAVTRVDFTDDRLEVVLRRLSHDERWGAFESALNQHTVRVYGLPTHRVHVDSTSASAYATVSEGGLLYVGGCKMASRETRARLAASGDFYLCPLPQVQLATGEFDAALEAIGSGKPTLSSVVREGLKGELELIAEGYEYPVAMSQQVGEQVHNWPERRLVVRSMRQAHAAEAALRARVAK